jgi:hypothetical protein
MAATTDHMTRVAPWSWLSLPDVRNWGSTPEERALLFPCDRYLSPADDVVYRGITVAAPAPIVFRWLCQLRVAPYSYDWIDNFGRTSPRHLVPGLERLYVGAPVMGFFKLVEFEPDRHVTAVTTTGTFRCAATYRVLPAGPARCRLLVKVLAAYPAALRPLMQRLFAPADWIMMRKQLLNLKELAEGDERRVATHPVRPPPTVRSPAAARRPPPHRTRRPPAPR